MPPPAFGGEDIVWQGSLLDDPASFAVYLETGACLGVSISEYALPSLVVLRKDALECSDITDEARACTIWQCGNACHGNLDFATCSPEYLSIEANPLR